MTDALWWTAAAARQIAADPGWPESLLDVPALVLDLREDQPISEPPPLRRAPCPVIGIASRGAQSAWPIDLTLVDGTPDAGLLADTVEEAAAVLAKRASANPQAAAILAQVLRMTPALDVDSALEVESLAYSMLMAGPEFRGWLASRPPPGPPDESSAELVLAERRDHVLHLTLNRPHVHNAFNAAMRDSLAEALAVALVDTSLRVEMSGDGRSFCSGGDLREFGTADDPVRAHLVRTARSVGALMHALHDRLTVVVHGSCIGAGVELPAFAAEVVAAPDATFRLPEVGMGLLPGAGGTVSVPRRIGAARTLLLALSGIALSAADAHRWGLIDAVY